MTIKLKNIAIKGIRGINKTLDLSLEKRSILLYGDNGAGKSSITDAIEWFYYDKVSHLSSNSEIDLKKALRNTYLPQKSDSEISITCNEKGLECVKQLKYVKDKLQSRYSNDSDKFKQYRVDSCNENVLLRHQLLRSFMDKTKSQKLDDLSNIIGFSEVGKIKNSIGKVFRALQKEIKNQNFEGQINIQKQTLINKIGGAISQENNLIEKINEIIEPLKTGISVKCLKDIEEALKHLKKPINTKLIAELNLLDGIQAILTNLKSEIILIDKEYQEYFTAFEVMASDVQSIMQIFLEDLLKTGKSVLEKKFHKDNTCPLCLQDKNIEELKQEIEKRLEGIIEPTKKKAIFDNAKQSIADIAINRIKRIDVIYSNPLLDEEKNHDIKKSIKNLRGKLQVYQKATITKVALGDKIPVPAEIILNDNDFKIQDKITVRINAIRDELKADKTTELFEKITFI